MYAGSSLTKVSGRIIGTHQKIDRTARHHLEKLLVMDAAFPRARRILQFEGRNGPDALKRKSPAHDEPWHFFDPFNPEDTQLQEQIQTHFELLVTELKNKNPERSAFEAAWLAHAIVDGLTPAHQYPHEAKLTELRGGAGLETRNTIMAKLVMPGENRRKKIKNNWLMWGPRGLLAGHMLFEFGITTILAPVSLRKGMPTPEDIKDLDRRGLIKVFEVTARDIAKLDMYTAYYRKGWTPKLVKQVKRQLGPDIARMVTLAWYAAAKEAGLA